MNGNKLSGGTPEPLPEPLFDAVFLFTRRGCAGCDALRGRLDEEGIAFHEWSADTPDGLAMACWYGVSEFPAIVQRARVLGEAEVQALLTRGPRLSDGASCGDAETRGNDDAETEGEA